MTQPMHPNYLPFSEDVLRGHFAPVGWSGGDVDRHLTYYRASVARLAAFEAEIAHGQVHDRAAIRRARQIEKDERFWTVAALLGVFHSRDRTAALAALLSRAFGDQPPVEALTSWEQALAGELHLFFEVNLPSPPSYRRWLRAHLEERAPIPYVLEAAKQWGDRLEGPTHADALLINADNGFAVIFEAKALSDIDSKVTFDVMRNQLARNIDVTLDRNPGLAAPLDRRDPDRTCVALLTPEVFRRNPHARLYGWLLPRYQQEPNALAADLPHRTDIDWSAVSPRLGWLTFEDCRAVVAA
jgi:hypothetical protein